MIVERADISAVRLCEERGMLPPEVELARAGLGMDEYRQRLRRLAERQVIRGYGAVLNVPPLLRGDWTWVALLASVARPLGAANLLASKLPFVADIVLNAGLPRGLGPNLAVLFYAREFENAARFVRSLVEMEHHEVQRVADYSFPVAVPLSTPERDLLRFLVANPAAGGEEVSAALGRPEDWVRTKFDRLLWSPENRSGLVRIQPDVDWSKVDNFGHFHFALVTGHRPDALERLVSDRGFSLVFGGRVYRERYVQVEADVWGVADLMERVAFLNGIAGIRVAGVTWNERSYVNSEWAAGLLDPDGQRTTTTRPGPAVDSPGSARQK
jgi:DNA-binding Lrp family transcriptional regulator